MSDFGRILEQWESSAGAKSSAQDRPKRRSPAMSDKVIDRYPPKGPGDREDDDRESSSHYSYKPRPEQIPVEGEIDLHGYRLEEAIMVTSRFVDESLELGRRKIRIIHGKGDNGQGVLRTEIRQLIEKHPRTGQMGYGKGSEGGRGALWVMLRY